MIIIIISSALVWGWICFSIGWLYGNGTFQIMLKSYGEEKDNDERN